MAVNMIATKPMMYTSGVIPWLFSWIEPKIDCGAMMTMNRTPYITTSHSPIPRRSSCLYPNCSMLSPALAFAGVFSAAIPCPFLLYGKTSIAQG